MRNILSFVVLAVCIPSLTSLANSQSYANVTVLDSNAAKALSLATDHLTTAGRASLNDGTAQMRRTDGKYDIQLNAPREPAHFTVDVGTSKVTALPTGRTTVQSTNLPGRYANAVTLAEGAFDGLKPPHDDSDLANTKIFEQLRASLHSERALDVRVSVPYANLPNIIYVWYTPQHYYNATAAPSATPGAVTIGCGKAVGYSIDVLHGLVTRLKLTC